MKKKLFLLIVLVFATLAASCNRPGSVLRDRFQSPDEPTPAAPVQLPQAETQAVDESVQLMNDLDALLNNLDTALYAEVEWQIDVPDETSLQSDGVDDVVAVGDLLDGLADSLRSLDDALAGESGQQINPP